MTVSFDNDDIRQLARAIGEQLQGCTGAPDETWHPSSEVPEKGLYIICTDKGAVYFSSTDGKKWDKHVSYWMRIPKPPVQVTHIA